MLSLLFFSSFESGDFVANRDIHGKHDTFVVRIHFLFLESRVFFGSRVVIGKK